MRADEELLEAWRAGDEGAGSRLLARNFEVLYRFFHNKVGPDAEDLIQQTLMTCVRHRDTFRGDCSFRTFLLRVARSRLYDFLRARSRSRVDPDLGVTSVVDLGTRVSRAVAGRQEHAAVVEALRELPVSHQVVLELQYWEELSAAEIASVVEEPVGTVKSRLRRAKQLLAERVQARLGGGIAEEQLDASLEATRPPPTAASE